MVEQTTTDLFPCSKCGRLHTANARWTDVNDYWQNECHYVEGTIHNLHTDLFAAHFTLCGRCSNELRKWIEGGRHAR